MQVQGRGGVETVRTASRVADSVDFSRMKKMEWFSSETAAQSPGPRKGPLLRSRGAGFVSGLNLTDHKLVPEVQLVAPGDTRGG